MTNINCLAGMQCPECKSFEPFAITVEAAVRVFDNGTHGLIGDTYWEDNSTCECCACDFIATVKDFTIEPQTQEVEA